jgi:hypothetical protein
MNVSPDDDRIVDLTDEDVEILPDQTRDDTDEGWGAWRGTGGDSRYLDDRPPHW